MDICDWGRANCPIDELNREIALIIFEENQLAYYRRLYYLGSLSLDGNLTINENSAIRATLLDPTDLLI